MSFIEKFGSSIRSDKKGHFAVGAIVGCSGYWNVAFALIAVQLIAIAKEYYDYLNIECHTVDFNDYVATVGGCAFTLTILLGFMEFKNLFF
jgi:hypothetical protein